MLELLSVLNVLYLEVPLVSKGGFWQDGVRPLESTMSLFKREGFEMLLSAVICAGHIK